MISIITEECHPRLNIFFRNSPVHYSIQNCLLSSEIIIQGGLIASIIEVVAILTYASFFSFVFNKRFIQFVGQSLTRGKCLRMECCRK